MFLLCELINSLPQGIDPFPAEHEMSLIEKVHYAGDLFPRKLQISQKWVHQIDFSQKRKLYCLAT